MKNFKLNEITAQQILDKYLMGGQIRDLVKEFGIHPATVSNLLKGKTWKNLSGRPSNICDIVKKRHYDWSLCSEKCRHEDKSLQPMTQHQTNLIIGSLLGDGWVQKFRKYGNSCFRKRHKKPGHIKWLFEELKPYTISLREVTTNQKRIRLPSGKVISEYVDKYVVGHELNTICHSYFTSLRKKWYTEEGVKRVPSDLILNPETLAIWYVDDGNNAQKYRYCSIATDGFTLEEVEFLCHRLAEDVNIYTKPNKHENKWNIQFGGENYDHLLDLVTPFVIWDDFKYKLTHIPLSRRRNLSFSEKNEIIKLYKQGMSCKELAEKFSIGINSIKIVVGYNRKSHLTDAQEIEIKQLRDSGMSTSDLAIKFGITRGAITHLLRKNNLFYCI